MHGLQACRHPLLIDSPEQIAFVGGQLRVGRRSFALRYGLRFDGQFAARPLVGHCAEQAELDHLSFACQFGVVLHAGAFEPLHGQPVLIQRLGDRVAEQFDAAVSLPVGKEWLGQRVAGLFDVHAGAR